jgi:hypothetical protein
VSSVPLTDNIANEAILRDVFDKSPFNACDSIQSPSYIDAGHDRCEQVGAYQLRVQRSSGRLEGRRRSLAFL